MNSTLRDYTGCTFVLRCGYVCVYTRACGEIVLVYESPAICRILLVAVGTWSIVSKTLQYKVFPQSKVHTDLLVV